MHETVNVTKVMARLNTQRDSRKYLALPRSRNGLARAAVLT